jgi:hypothetical protein
MNNQSTIGQAEIDRAKMLAHWANGRPEQDAERAYERLFRTEDGRHFLVIERGTESGKIVVCSREEAREWTQRRADPLTTQRLFG